MVKEISAAGGKAIGFATDVTKRAEVEALIKRAVNGFDDDTGMRIPRLARNTDDGLTGAFTSGIVSIWREWRIALYFTGWKHAGGNPADVLKQRAVELATTIQMCDARELSARLRSGWQGRDGRSGAHVFRKQGVHIVTDAIAEIVADGARAVQPGDEGAAFTGG